MSNNCCVGCRNRGCISKVPMFQNISAKELGELKRKICHKEYSRGEIIFKEGDIADKMYFVNEGKIKIYKYNKDGKEQILHMISDSDFFGELHLLKSSEYKFFAKAIEGCKICTLSKDEMKDTILSNPDIAIKMLENVAEKMVEVENLAQELSTNDVDSRVAYLISNFMDKFGEEDEETGSILIKLPFSREDMANYIGVTRETISRKLRKFQDENLINMIGSKTIVVLDEEAIRDYI